MRPTRRHAVLAFALGVFPAALGAVRAGGDGGDAGSGAPAEVVLTSVRQNPSPHLGAKVSLVVQFREPVEGWTPLLTRFGTDDFRALSVWSDERMLWREEDWEDPFERLFVRRSGQPDLALGAARAHERWLLTAVVQDVLLGEPWIEVLTARRLPEYVSEGSVLHAGRALMLIEEARFDLARGEIDRAEAGPLPEHARAELAALRAEVDRREAERARILREHKR